MPKKVNAQNSQIFLKLFKIKNCSKHIHIFPKSSTIFPEHSEMFPMLIFDN